MRKFFTITCLFIVSCCKVSLSQTIPVGTPLLEDYYRRLQLAGDVDSTLSFTIRPIYASKALKVADVYHPDNNSAQGNYNKSLGQVFFAGKKGLFQVLPLSFNQQYNSNHPYGWNDGVMIPAKGYQASASAGFYLKLGPLSIQFKPEYIYAQNLMFNGFASGHSDQELVYYYQYHNLIDQPERLADGAYKRMSWGQTSVRLTAGPVSLGLSNENLWWGPGIKNALILTNNAPGFKHITLNTVRPIHTAIGSFEGQLIAARMDGTNRSPLAVTKIANGDDVYVPKRNEWNYYTGYNISYQPKWVPGLFLGWIRTFNAYHSDVKGFSGYFPFFVPFQKVNTNDGDPFDRDQQTSFYARWLFTKAKAEVYFEYGINDNSYNFRDFIGSPQHSRAYLFGVRKLFPMAGRNGQGILFNTEITQLSQTPDYIIRDASGWYIHSKVRSGQTNLGQILGAGTGSGGNLQSMDISWVAGLKSFGFTFERYEHDVDFANYGFKDINGNSRKWVDLSAGLQANFTYKSFLINTSIKGVKSLNYQWILKNYVPDKYYIPNNDVFNFYSSLGVSYRF